MTRKDTANMKRQIIKILGFLVLIGFNSNDYKPKYKDFENAWEREKLDWESQSLT